MSAVACDRTMASFLSSPSLPSGSAASISAPPAGVPTNPAAQMTHPKVAAAALSEGRNSRLVTIEVQKVDMPTETAAVAADPRTTRQKTGRSATSSTSCSAKTLLVVVVVVGCGLLLLLLLPAAAAVVPNDSSPGEKHGDCPLFRDPRRGTVGS